MSETEQEQVLRSKSPPEISRPASAQYLMSPDSPALRARVGLGQEQPGADEALRAAGTSLGTGMIPIPGLVALRTKVINKNQKRPPWMDHREEREGEKEGEGEGEEEEEEEGEEEEGEKGDEQRRDSLLPKGFLQHFYHDE